MMLLQFATGGAKVLSFMTKVSLYEFRVFGNAKLLCLEPWE
jgi:hypothetical protein